MKEIVIATKNQGKAREYAAMFAPLGIKVKTLADVKDAPEIVEDGQTFTENALKKAQTLSDFLQMPVLADDSGLVVDALNGEPGIYSARYAGDHDDDKNNEKLLANLAEVADDKRTAHFHCSVVVTSPIKDPLVVEGDAYGKILHAKRGKAGFGYDPLFFYPELGKTFAELSQDEKNEVSHRGLALRKLMTQLADWWD
ncbi:MAG: XTP/dITP diphosphatase [Ligilactobacillus sp.]|nr:XTP/dITP diphosphatase [Ligilactobacillus sp.]